MTMGNIPYFDCLASEIRKNESVHLATLNAQYCYAILFENLLDKFPKNTRYCIDSRPISYFQKVTKKNSGLKQGADMKDEIIQAAAIADHVVIIGGSSEPFFLDHLGPDKKTVIQGKIDAGAPLMDRIGKTITNKKKILFLLFLGIPKQDVMAEKIHEEFDGGRYIVTIGLGGSLDFWSGRIRRAPLMVRAICMEGLWRLMMEPSWKRLWRLYISVIGLLLSPVAFRKVGLFNENHH